jgi:hypothetical protein
MVTAAVMSHAPCGDAAVLLLLLPILLLLLVLLPILLSRP